MLKIIVVDDERHIRQGLVRTIQELSGDFEVCAAAQNGEEALELIKKYLPDVVVTDIKMPKMDGLELASELSKAFPAIRKVILSGFDEFEYVRKSMRSGAVDFLLKPVDEEELRKILIKIYNDIKNETQEAEKESENIRILRQELLRKLCSGDKTIREEELLALGIYPHKDSCGAILVSVDNIRHISKKKSFCLCRYIERVRRSNRWISQE